jgi:polysaccharide export outer membrane protein
MTSRMKLRLTSLFAVLLLLSSPLLAQFNGPTSLGGAEINRPTVLTTDDAVLFPTLPDVVLSAGDAIFIHVYGEADYSPSVRIAADGNVDLPLIGKIHLGGLSVSQAEALVAHRLIEDGMFRDPQVLLQITEGPTATVTVIGEVRGVIPVVGSRHLLDILALAGGLPPTASHVITINRPGIPDPIVIDLGNDPLRSRLANIPIFPGDTVVVSRIGVVYVMGGFGTIGVIPLNSYSNLTMTELVSLSGGVKTSAKLHDLRIIRTSGNHRTVTTLDMKNILNGKAPDPYLQPNDLIYMPNSIIKSVFSLNSLGTVLGLTSIILSLTLDR